MRRQPDLATQRTILALLALQMSCLAQADTQTTPPGPTLELFSPSPLLILLVVIAIEAFLLHYLRAIRNQLSRALVDGRSDEKVRPTVLSGYSDLPLGQPRPAAAAANPSLQDAAVEHDALAGRLVDQAAPNLPMVNILAQAVQAIGPALGGSIPPVALITTLIGVGSRLDAPAHAHWIARIMDLPYTPRQPSSKLFDSNAAISVITEVPTLRRAFGPQLAAGDRASAADVVELALGADGREALVNKYPRAFADLTQSSIESAVRDLQKAALDFVLRQEVPLDAVKDVGGLASVLKAVDQVRGNRDARAALDLVMTTANALRSNQLHPELVFTNAASLLFTSNIAQLQHSRGGLKMQAAMARTRPAPAAWLRFARASSPGPTAPAPTSSTVGVVAPISHRPS